MQRSVTLKSGRELQLNELTALQYVDIDNLCPTSGAKRMAIMVAVAAGGRVESWRQKLESMALSVADLDELGPIISEMNGLQSPEDKSAAAE